LLFVRHQALDVKRSSFSPTRRIKSITRIISPNASRLNDPRATLNFKLHDILLLPGLEEETSRALHLISNRSRNTDLLSKGPLIGGKLPLHLTIYDRGFDKRMR